MPPEQVLVITQHALPAVAGKKPARHYQVRPGDYLSKIASAQCGTPADWTGIYDRNQKLIGPNPDLIIAGENLILDCREGRVHTTPEHRLAWQPQSQPVTVSWTGDPSGQLTRQQVGSLWLEAGGPSWAEYAAEQVSYCESGWNTRAYNPSGATGLFQILGAVLPGDLWDGLTNARNAVSKFEASGDTWSQWVCKP
jgi:hypothetical protein